MSPSRMAEQVGRVLGGRYRLTGLIGTGASGHVFLAEDATLGRPVAVKLLHAALAGDEAFLRRFRAEAQSAAVLNHPNIMGVLDWGEDAGGPFLVLEHLGGGSLRDLLDTGARLSPAQAAAVGLQAARGLAYAHRRHLVHRDVKPANLLFDEDAHLRIADFGLARALAEAAWTEPVGALLGTARYSSPEAAQGHSVDGRADVYALGLVLVESVTGALPFSADSTIATLMARVGTRPAVPAELGPLQEVVERMTGPEPSERLDAASLASALEAVARWLPPPERLALAGPAVNTQHGDSTDLGIRAHPILVVPEPRPPVAAAGGAPETGPVLETGPAGETGPVGQVTEAFPPVVGAGGTGAEAVTQTTPVVTGRARGRRRRGRRAWLVVLILVLLLGGGGYGAYRWLRVPSFAVPSVVRLAPAQAVAQLSAPPERWHVVAGTARYDEVVPAGRVAAQSPPPRAELSRGGTVHIFLSRGPQPRPVPNLAGLSQAAARDMLAGKGFGVSFVQDYSETVNAGIVLSWTPNSGAQPKGSVVTVTVSEGPRPRVVPPGLVGQSFEAAQSAIQAQDLVAAPQDVYSDSVGPGLVVSSDPAPGQSTPRGSTVTVSVSKGPHVVTMPNVYSQPGRAAAATLRNDGFTVHVYGPDTNGPVIFTDPAPNSQVHYGASVSVFVL